jgi:hypothetical protein
MSKEESSKAIVLVLCIVIDILTVLLLVVLQHMEKGLNRGSPIKCLEPSLRPLVVDVPEGNLDAAFDKDSEHSSRRSRISQSPDELNVRVVELSAHRQRDGRRGCAMIVIDTWNFQLPYPIPGNKLS